jgi:hypothetical protein
MIIAGTFIYFLSTPPQNYLYPVQFSPRIMIAAAGWMQDVCRSACRSAALLK